MLFRSLPKVTSETTQSLLTTNKIKSDKFVRCGVKSKQWTSLADLTAQWNRLRSFSKSEFEQRLQQVLTRRKNQVLGELLCQATLEILKRVLTWKQLLASIQKDFPREAMALNNSYTTSFVNNFDDFYTGLSCLLMDLAQYAPDILFKCCFIAG